MVERERERRRRSACGAAGEREEGHAAARFVFFWRVARRPSHILFEVGLTDLKKKVFGGTALRVPESSLTSVLTKPVSG